MWITSCTEWCAVENGGKKMQNLVEWKDVLESLSYLIAYSVLFAIFERAFVMCKARGFNKHNMQWQGWVEVMHVYAQRDN